MKTNKKSYVSNLKLQLVPTQYTQSRSLFIHVISLLFLFTSDADMVFLYIVNFFSSNGARALWGCLG
jgi:hypothetical protein